MSFVKKNTERRTPLRVVLLVFAAAAMIATAVLGMLSTQYNITTGMSWFILVCYDDSQPKEAIGEMNGYTIYVEGISKTDTVVQNVFADAIVIGDAVKSGKLSADTLTKKARQVYTEGAYTHFVFENYEIIEDGATLTLRQHPAEGS